MKATVAMTAAALAFAATSALAGEDSTDRWGAGGTGVSVWESNCGLHTFPGPVDDRNAQRPCGFAGAQKEVAEKRSSAAQGGSAPAASGRTVPAYQWKSEEKDR